MKLTFKEWFLFILVGAMSLGIWYKYSYPQFKSINLSLDKKEALERAENYLVSQGVDPKEYSKSIVFYSDDWADIYLQKTVGFMQEEEFFKQHNYELFSWEVRFFKESQKEEYILYLSPKTGEILHFNHKIEDIEPRQTLEKDIAKTMAQDFLEKNYRLNLVEYEFNEEKIKSFDKRTDYTFSWKKKGVSLPWKDGQGTAKLLCGATVSGTEIRTFYRSELDIPEKFSRYIEKQLAFGEYLSSFAYVFFLILVVMSIYLLVKKRQEVSLRIVKNWFIYLAAFLYLFNIAYLLNNLQQVFNDYPTSVSISTYIGLYLLHSMIGILFLSVNCAIPGMMGEAIQQEILPQRSENSFLHYLKSTFYNRGMARAIVLGYLLFAILLGAQSGIFAVGQKYMGVWKQWIKLTQFSSASIPLLTAFALSITASFSEELVFRLFGISWGKKYLRNTVLAVVLTSLIWGFGHTQYAIFPVWFRGIEVSILGFFYGFIFIKYGIIPLLVAHYLFDIFWGTAPYLLGHSLPDLFIGSIFLLAIPLIFASFCSLANRSEKEREIISVLSANQEYNLNVLVNFVLLQKSKGLTEQDIKKELASHGWDSTLVDLAVAKAFKG